MSYHSLTVFVYAMHTLCVGSDGYVVPDFPLVIIEIDIEASAVQDISVKP